MDYHQLVLDNEALLADLPAELQQSASSQLLRSLPQLHAESTRFAVRQTKRPDADAAQAQLVLARAGFDLTKEKRNLDKIDLSSAYEDFEPSSEQNLERYLDYQHSLLVNTLIEENNSKITKDFRDNYESHLDRDWQKQKNRLLRNLRLNFADESSQLQPEKHDQNSSLPPISSSPAQFGPNVSKESQYADAVEKVVNDRGHCSELFGRACESFAHYSGSPSSAVSKLWKLMEEMSYSTAAHGSCPAPLHILLGASTKYLCAQFKEWLAGHIARVRIGGRLGFANQIRAFLREVMFRQRFPEFLKNLLVDEVPLWPQIFYCLRCGDTDEAIQIANNALRQHSENDQVSTFVSCLSTFVSLQPLSSSQFHRLRSDYNTFVRDGQDPFEVAVYNIVACGNLEQYDTMKYRALPDQHALFQRFITPSHTDYMWLQLCLLGRHKEMDARLREFQEKIRSYEQHFSRNQSDPLLYFLVLVLSLQFSCAVTYLFSTTEYRIDAVHFAIALDEMGLLSTQMTASPDSVDKVQIDQIVRSYVLEDVNFPPSCALHYIVLLLHRHNPQFDPLFRDLLVGNGHRTPIQQAEVVRNLIDKDHGIARDFIPSEQLHKLCLEAAVKAQQDESFLVACELFSVAEAQPQEQYAQCLVRLLSRHLTNISHPVRRLACERAKPLVSSTELSNRVRDALDSLYQLIEFFNANQSVRFDDSLQIASYNPSKNSGFVPLANKEVDAALQRFEYLNDISLGAVARHLPQVATIVIKIIYDKYKASQRASSVHAASALRELREQAQALHTFHLRLEAQGHVGSYDHTFGKFYRSICHQ